MNGIRTRKQPYEIPAPDSEAAKAETYLAAEVTLVKEGNFYQISNAEQLAAFRDIVNGATAGIQISTPAPN